MSRVNRKLLRLSVLSAIHALFMVATTLFLLEMNFTYGDEKYVVKWSTIIKKVILGFDNKPEWDKLLFINTSYDNMLIERLDEDGFATGNRVITDREKLARLFEAAGSEKSQHRYIICDIFFRDASPFDSLLNENIKRIKNVIIPYHTGEDNKIEEPLFNINKGFSDYNVIENSFLKYSLMQYDSLASLPLKMYMDLYNADFHPGLISRMNGKASFNTIIIDFKVRDIDIREEKSGHTYPYVNLGEFTELPDSVIRQTLKDRIVVIGDFRERDLHQTIIGPMHGGMILLNVFLSLENNENTIKPFFIIILFIVFFLVSLDIFSDKNIRERKYVKKLSKNRFGKFMVKFLEYLVYLIIASVIIYIFYNIHINILIAALYLKVLDSLTTKGRNIYSEMDVQKGFINKTTGFIKIIPKLLKPQS